MKNWMMSAASANWLPFQREEATLWNAGQQLCPTAIAGSLAEARLTKPPHKNGCDTRQQS